MYQQKLKTAKIILIASFLGLFVVSLAFYQLEQQSKRPNQPDITAQDSLIARSLAQSKEKELQEDSEEELDTTQEDIEQVRRLLDAQYASNEENQDQQEQQNQNNETYEINPEEQQTPTEEIPQTTTNTHEMVLNNAITEFAQKRYTNALEDFKYLAENAEDQNIKTTAKQYILRCYEEKGRLNEAYGTFEKFYTQSKNVEDLIVLLGLAPRVNKINTTNAYLQKHLEFYPQDREKLENYIK